MDEDQEMEKFGTENDFEGGEWIGGEFYYKKRRDKHVQTREDVLYGVFQANSSDSDGEGGSSRRRKRRKGKDVDLTKPVNFISTGTVMPNKEVDKNSKEEKNADDDMFEEAENDGGRAGLGAGSGLGFNSGFNGNSNGVERAEGAEQGGGNASEDDEVLKFFPEEFGRSVKERKERERLKKKEEREGRGGGKRKEAGFGDIGKFEQHTKGIGMKLLEKMGYKGGGLGKNKQGIAAPIEAILRPKGMGMGYNDYKEVSASVPQADEKKAITQTQSQAAGRSKEKLWLKGKKKKFERYVTVKEVLEKKEEQGFEITQKVIDMRGPQVRVLTNLENLNAEDEARDNDIPMPELQYNIRLIVDMAEADIQKIDSDLRRERDTATALQAEKEKLAKDEARQKKQLGNMEEIMGVMSHIEEQKALGSLTLDDLGKCFSELRMKFPDEYTLGNLSCIACSFALPLFIRVFQGWDPLTNPMHGFKLIESWRTLLQGDESHHIWDVGTPYTQLVSEVVWPAIQVNGTTWEPRDPEPMLRFLESWEKLLPASVTQNILDNVVLQKLSTAVNSWDPRIERVAIHVWVHPWLPQLGPKLEVLYETIQIKLRNTLVEWHPSDASAYAILSPWKTVFDPISWENLMRTSILPKLQGALEDFQINPASQNLNQFNWVLSWASVLPIHLVVDLMVRFFFVKWLQVLYHWLCTNPNMQEVHKWYVGWKDLLPPELQAHENIRYQFTIALQMIDQAIEGQTIAQPGLRANLGYHRGQEQRAAAIPPVQQAAMGGVVEMSLKDVVEAHAQENGLQFVLKPNKMHDGHQMYGYGNVSVYMDTLHQKLYALNGQDWVLSDLDMLLTMHYNSLRRNR
ncbi:unnamed protein product [Linum tenue]|uniref:G-patch domain-containing protein n=1 Tax=Linum tenue TaxID=586396 RepID=A0AAV0KNF8_9ROSI|nr:unnamed protein product [Linum tenue]